jgi:dienelactone hydrolase
MPFRRLLAFVCVVCCFGVPAVADEPKPETSRGDIMIAEYFRAETAKLAERCLADIKSLDDWTSRRDEYRRQLAEMLGLDPMPQRTALKPVVTGTLENEYFTVENLHFQSSPGLYVTGNLYLPKGLDTPAPAVLYVCGHGQVKKDGVSLGNKTHYQHHGGWFARNGFVCLTIDTIQLGEIEGLHHGTYREGMWWWNSRGYTPAGVEAWNGIRALDYLQSRPEVDGERLGVTGRSGGGAYSWWIAALDERIKAAVPVAGITDLTNHVVDGCVDGHCDCMFMVNTYRWDFPQVAALVAPRALLIANSDKDPIFPLDGVERLHAKVRRIYRLHDADDKLGLQISEGPHKDTQELQVAAMHWFNRFLKGEDPPVENTGITYFEPEQLRVFRDGLPGDEITSKIHETFVSAAAAPTVPATKEEWDKQRDEWMTALKEKCFRCWPEEPGPLNVEEIFSAENDEDVLTAYEFNSEQAVRTRLYLMRDAKSVACKRIDLFVLSVAEWDCLVKLLQLDFPSSLHDERLPEDFKLNLENMVYGLPSAQRACAFLAPRGVGPTAWDQSEGKQIQNRRRFMLLGQTLATMQAWDVRRAMQALRSAEPFQIATIDVSVSQEMSTVTLFASLFEPAVSSLWLANVPVASRMAPDLLNFSRYLDIPQVVALAATRSNIQMYQNETGDWDYAARLSRRFGQGGTKFDVQRAKKIKDISF